MLITILSLVYVAIVLMAIFIFLFTKNTILVRVRTLFKFHSIFLLFSLIVFIIQYPQVPIVYGVSLILLTGFFFIFQNVWVLLHYKKDKTAEVIENSLNMILFPFQKSEGSYRLSHSGGESNILIKPLFAGLASVAFENKFTIKKVDILKALLVKKFGKIFPRFTIHI